MKNRLFGRAAAVLGLAAGAALVAVPASADADDITNATTTWEWVYDEGGAIEDAFAFYPGLAADGGDIWGWTGDAFDTFLYEVGLSTPDDSDGVDAYDFVAVSDTRVDGGVSTIVSEAALSLYDSTADDFFDYTVRMTLTIEGSYARWDVEVVADVPSADTERVLDTMVLAIGGELGSDSSTVYETVGADALVSHDEDGYDPIVAYDLVGDVDSIEAYDGDDEPWFYFGLDADPSAAVIVSLLDYAPCGRDAAIAAQLAAAPTLADTFGQDLRPDATDACASVDAAETVDAGTEFAQFLALTITEEAIDGWLEHEVPDWFYPEVALVDGPAGVEVELVEDDVTGDPYVALGGTVAAAGTYEVTAVLYLTDGTESGLPYFLSIPLTVVEPVVVEEEPVAEPSEEATEEIADETDAVDDTVETDEAVLAETGFESGLAGTVAVLMLGLGAAAVVTARRRA
ncbi:hypothetical protein [Demequina subtropica]|uniref:hypothetical protein n=1 Tax=Demequina subtropica TaxID=1638989 RepID=UPI000785E776|nr:hypothetical protein [Demequina subtropica]